MKLRHSNLVVLVAMGATASAWAQSSETPEALKARVTAWLTETKDAEFVGLIEYDQVIHLPAEPFRANFVQMFEENTKSAEQDYEQLIARLAKAGDYRNTKQMLESARRHRRSVANLAHMIEFHRQWAERGVVTGSLKRIYLGEGSASRVESSEQVIDPPNPERYKIVQILAIASDGDAGWQWSGPVDDGATPGWDARVQPLTTPGDFDQNLNSLNQTVRTAKQLLNPKASFQEAIEIKSVERKDDRILVRFGRSGDQEQALTYEGLMELEAADGGFRVMHVETAYTRDGMVHEGVSTFGDYRRVDAWDAPFFQASENCEMPAAGMEGLPRTSKTSRTIRRIRPGLSAAERKCFSPPANAFDQDKKGETPQFKYEDLSPAGVAPRIASAGAADASR